MSIKIEGINKRGDFSSPEVSVVIVTPDTYETIRETINHLRAQTVKDKLEIVIVAPSVKTLNPDESELQDFAQSQVVIVGEIKSIAWGNAAGIRHANAPIVALAEDHSYPDPSWAEALIRAHRQQWVAVGPVVRNANPENAISWADLLIGYGPWLDPTPARIVSQLPGHNCSYKKAVLLEYGHKLESMLEAETVLHWDLCSRGFQIYLDSAAKISHTNFSLLSSWIPVQFLAGRVFAAARSRNWSLSRRIIYVGGSPMIPVVRFWRTVLEMYKPGRLQNMRSSMKLCVLLALILGLALDGVGQFVGYVIGAGDSKEKLSKYEFHRYRHLSRKNKKQSQSGNQFGRYIVDAIPRASRGKINRR